MATVVDESRGGRASPGARRSPYRIEGPTLISFSGGRTSAYMLWHILEAYDGQLPEDVHVCFANTGKEREETLRFVHDCAVNWGVRVRWLEWWVAPDTPKGKRLPPDQRFREVGYNSASRQGEPFVALIERRGFLPNVVTRFCTSALKINTMECFMRAQGLERWSNAVGLRADELHRVFKQIERNTAGHRSTAVMPLATAGVHKEDVLAFWAAQPFDLGLRGYEGNCDLCFLKGERILQRIVAENPGMADWWIEQETDRAGQTRDPAMAQFSRRFSYAGLVNHVARSPRLDLGLDELEFDAECGVTCAGDVDRALAMPYQRGCGRRRPR